MSQTWRVLPPVRATDSVTALASAGGATYAGTTAGLFRRNGASWERVGGLAATEIQAIALGETPSLVAVGAGNAVDVSRDGGRSWTRGELDTEGRVTAVGISPKVLLAGTDRDGAYLSRDGGETWQRHGLEGQMVLAVADAQLAGTDSGLWQRDPASGWRKLSLDAVCTSLATAGDAIVAGTEEQGLFRSTDEGKTWQRCPDVDDGINALAASGKRLLAGASSGRTYESRDGGASWSELEPLPTAVMSLALDGDTALAGSYLSGLFQFSGGAWQTAGDGLESTNAIDLVAGPDGPLVVALDGLRRFDGSAWQPLDPGIPGDPRAACTGGDGPMLLATTEGVFAGADKLATIAGATLLRRAPNGDLAVLTEDALHLRLGGEWTQVPRSERERVIDVLFSPSYPEDDGLLLCTLRQGTRVSVVRYAHSSQQMERLLDYDGHSRWLAMALPPDYHVDSRRPAAFFAGTGGSLFRPSWPGDAWQRDIIHDAEAIVLSLALSPSFAEDNTVVAGTTTGAVFSHNAGLLWLNMNDGLEDTRILKLVYGRDGRLFALTPTRVYTLE